MFPKVKEDAVHALIMEQIADVEACLISFEGFLRAAGTDSSVETLRALCDSVYEKEAAADRSLRKMIDSLAGTAFLPSSREDLIEIATACDKVANKCETVAKMFIYKHFRCPAEYSESLIEIMAITHEQFDLLEKSISMLFSKFNEMLKDHSILNEISLLETKVDVVEEKLYEQIAEADVELAYRCQLFDFVEAVCDLSDIIENISDKIRIMLVTRKV